MATTLAYANSSSTSAIGEVRRSYSQHVNPISVKLLDALGMTFSENSPAMRAGIATIEAVKRERLSERADSLGTEFRERLREALKPYEMVKEVRGEGCLESIRGVVETVRSSSVFWIDALNLGRRAMSL